MQTCDAKTLKLAKKNVYVLCIKQIVRLDAIQIKKFGTHVQLQIPSIVEEVEGMKETAGHISA